MLPLFSLPMNRKPFFLFSCSEREEKPSLVSTRHYRAPEVVAEEEWGTPIDVWSVAMVLIELLTGDLVIKTHFDVGAL